MKNIIILSCMLLSGCHKCAYGYSSACGANDAQDQQQQDQENKDKPKEKAPSIGWH